MPEGNLSVKHIESCFQTGNYDKILSSDEVKAPRIQTFDFVRVLGMMMVFAQHVWAMVSFHMPDLGGKGVDLFFVMSGLVMTYNYYDIDLEPSVKGNAAFALRRIKKVLLPACIDISRICNVASKGTKCVGITREI